MKFSSNQQDIQSSLNYCQGIIEKRSTLPILSNVLLNVSNSLSGKVILHSGTTETSYISVGIV